MLAHSIGATPMIVAVGPRYWNVPVADLASLPTPIAGCWPIWAAASRV